MLPDRVSNPGPLTYESGALPTALRGPACYLCKNGKTAGNTLEGNVSDVIALDQLLSPFSPRKATRMSP